MGSLAVGFVVFCLAVLRCRSQACDMLSSCNACIANFSCVWCSTHGNSQCFPREEASKMSSCTEFVDPASNVTVVQRPLSESRQVSVDSVRMNLRVGETQNFTVSVRSAENFPLDLYILMDFSRSFQDDLESARKTAGDIIIALQNVTSQFRVGFGKFTDKPTPPYTSYATLDLAYMVDGMKSSCRSVPGVEFTSPCGRPIPYEHIVTLTNSSMDFSSAIQTLVIEVSTDDPEGILDAMMQAIVCTDIVGWREEARKVLLVMTDDVAHTAGDGRLAGIHTPNDGQCHTCYDPQLNKTLYTGALDYDYPSIEHLQAILERNGVVPVFAIADGSQDLSNYYQHLSNLSGGFMANLGSGSSNLVEVITESYSQVVSHVELTYAQKPNFVDISIVANCPGGSVASTDASCDGVDNQEVVFQVSVTLTNHSELLQGGEAAFDFYIPGFGAFTIQVRSEFICDCARLENIDSDSLTCSGNGDLVCGQCQCRDGWQADACDCQVTPCPVGPNGLECSGSARGTCNGCGDCVCNTVEAGLYPGIENPVIYGSACQCDNFLCDRGSNGLVCSGRGVCSCSQGIHDCNCGVSSISGSPYSGDACECSTDSCINPANASTGVCGGHGDCQGCNPQGSACVCLESFYGAYCESVISSAPSCSDADSTCIKCYSDFVDEGVDLTSICGDQCLNYSLVGDGNDDSYQIPGTLAGSTVSCEIGEIQCTYAYYIGTAVTGETVVVVEARTCLPLPWYVIPILFIIGLILIALVIVVIARLAYFYLDYREAKRFKWEVARANFNVDNPVYQGPIKKYENPQYDKKVPDGEDL